MADEVDRLLIEDGASGPLSKIAAAADKAAAAMDAVGEAFTTTEQEVGKGAWTLEQYENKASGVSAAVRQLSRAKQDLAGVEEAAALAVARGERTQASAAQTIDAYRDRVVQLQARLDGLRAAHDAGARGFGAFTDAVRAAEVQQAAAGAAIARLTEKFDPATASARKAAIRDQKAEQVLRPGRIGKRTGNSPPWCLLRQASRQEG